MTPPEMHRSIYFTYRFILPLPPLEEGGVIFERLIRKRVMRLKSSLMQACARTWSLLSCMNLAQTISRIRKWFSLILVSGKLRVGLKVWIIHLKSHFINYYLLEDDRGWLKFPLLLMKFPWTIANKSLDRLTGSHLCCYDVICKILQILIWFAWTYEFHR